MLGATDTEGLGKHKVKNCGQEDQPMKKCSISRAGKGGKYSGAKMSHPKRKGPALSCQEQCPS